jgi:hypothetical protein
MKTRAVEIFQMHEFATAGAVPIFRRERFVFTQRDSALRCRRWRSRRELDLTASTPAAQHRSRTARRF